MADKRAKKAGPEDARYHDTWRLLKKYRDVVWSLELSVQHLKREFEMEYGSSVDDYLESIYLAGTGLGGTSIEAHARCIERSCKMLTLIDQAVELLRTRHKNGEMYYWLLYYTYLSPQELQNVDEIIQQLQPHIRDLSIRSYYRQRKAAITALGNVLWGYTDRSSLDILDRFFPTAPDKK